VSSWSSSPTISANAMIVMNSFVLICSFFSFQVSECSSPGRPKKVTRFRSNTEEDREVFQAVFASRGVDDQDGHTVNGVDARNCLQRLVTSHTFDLFIAVAIVTNAILIGADVHYRSVRPLDRTPLALEMLHFAYAIIFCAELVLRGIAERAQFCIGKSKYWNLFDLSLGRWLTSATLLRSGLCTPPGCCDC